VLKIYNNKCRTQSYAALEWFLILRLILLLFRRIFS